ncbi:hypothetical protein GH714_010365 [Hevea brasiliensis]|uniref:Uncharacterized protein n=1 Tax=Hevea brasiliensis TaxID=3981 RepID=A0A6A6LJ98_HEVBR|nr:hypothetical protein GH714_010365 [Hevea brasiliensis]
MISFIKCPNPVYSPSYLDCSTCINGGSALQTHTYAKIIDLDTGVSDLMESCSVEMISLLPDEKAFENKDNNNPALKFTGNLHMGLSLSGTTTTISISTRTLMTLLTTSRLLLKL